MHLSSAWACVQVKRRTHEWRQVAASLRCACWRSYIAPLLTVLLHEQLLHGCACIAQLKCVCRSCWRMQRRRLAAASLRCARWRPCMGQRAWSAACPSSWPPKRWRPAAWLPCATMSMPSAGRPARVYMMTCGAKGSVSHLKRSLPYFLAAGLGGLLHGCPARRV